MFSIRKKIAPNKTAAAKKCPDDAWTESTKSEPPENDEAATNDVEMGLRKSVDANPGHIEVRRSKSRVRSYLKKCKDKLTGQQHSQGNTTCQNPDCCNVPSTSHASSATSSWYVEDAEPPDITKPDDSGGGGSNEMKPKSEPILSVKDESASGLNADVDNGIAEKASLTKVPIMDTGLESLLDRYLEAVYPLYYEKTKRVLLRQARDILVCTYHGCLKSFEEQFLAPLAEMLIRIREEHEIGQDTIWCKGWPLALSSGAVVLHLGMIDESSVRNHDLYLCARPAENSKPELCIAWRSPPKPDITCRILDPTSTSFSPFSIEMLADELPQLLQNLLVSVERVIGRVPLNDLSYPSTLDNLGNSANTSNGNEGIRQKSNIGEGNVTNSPKCVLKRSDLITKGKMMNSKYILRRFSTKFETSACESASADAKNLPTPGQPVFCLGGSFPHIDSDEENPEERKSSNTENQQQQQPEQLPHEISAPRSILEVPEKLLSSGIHLPGTRDLKGRPIITIEASNVTEAGLNCYEVATVLLYYSTIPERSSPFTILIISSSNSDLNALDLVCNSLKLIVGHFHADEILVTSLNANCVSKTVNEPKVKFLQIDQFPQYISKAHTPKQCSGSHLHDQNKWRELFVTIDPFQSQCLTTGQRLVSALSDVRNSDLQGLPSRRQLYSQHRALSRALMDTDLIYLRKRGASTVSRLQDLAKNLNRTHTKSSLAEDKDQAVFENTDVINRIKKVIFLFNEVDRAAKRLEQLTEQRRERLRELTRQKALEDEMNEVSAWIQNDGEEALQRFASVQLECEDTMKDHEQDFDKYYFISLKHLAKGKDLHDAAVNLDPLKETALQLKDSLQKFSERLEKARERIEGAARLHHLIGLHLREDDILLEMQKLTEKIGVPGLIEKCRNRKADDNNKNAQTKQHVRVTGGAIATSTPEKSKLESGERPCHCWRGEELSQGFACEKGAENEEDEEEDHSKIADSGLGGCDRCEGNNGKLTRACSCQSFDDNGNLYDKSHNIDELEEDCFERNSKQFMDVQSPMEANSHLQCHASSLELSQIEELSGLDTKVQKTLLFIMREMIVTERDYVRSLYYVIDNYMDELLRDDIPQALRGQRNVIFGNIEKIFEFHQPHFLAELERCENNPLKVGAAFLANESKFYLYALYNKNKPKSDTLMSEYGTAFFKSKQLELNDKMDLASYLLKPVQRMGKYALLLQQLVKACSGVQVRTHPFITSEHVPHIPSIFQGPALQDIQADVEELQRAEEMVKFQLRHGNDLLAMDSLRDCDVNVKEQGRLLRQNEFLVWQGRGGKKCLRQVFLFEDLVLFSKARRFPDHKNLDIYIYKNSIKTSDIGLTAHVGDAKTKFEIWFRKRKPDDTWTLQSMSEDIKNIWTEEISKLLWKQAKRNREIRLAEMSSMGIGNKPCLDIRPSHNQINDRSITFSQLGQTPKLRNSYTGSIIENKSNRRPHSIISESSMSSGTSSSSGASSGNGSSFRASGLELISEAGNLPLNSSDKKHQRSTTLVSQLSMESGILSDISTTPDGDMHEPSWPTATTINRPKHHSATAHDLKKSQSMQETQQQSHQSQHQQKFHSELNIDDHDPYIGDSITVHL
ncbi:uncharacterized protein LOC119648013 isoform X4 [Hermetia illucens]|uniref:uncharacterized protein LOC119648013 isoform X4 n=1 Tax=Hermetia illucens TaxID=343691 RepID=UPI0018CC3686|nr:uncharacterized protein LOC119648013 isoform X4 [Hermetia illucens]